MNYYDRNRPMQGAQVWQQWPHVFKFNHPRRRVLRPVKGGRWSVRQVPLKLRNSRTSEKPWKAWTAGTAKRWNRTFATFDQAIQHAQFVASCYEAYGREKADEHIKTILHARQTIDMLVARTREKNEDARRSKV